MVGTWGRVFAAGPGEGEGDVNAGPRGRVVTAGPDEWVGAEKAGPGRGGEDAGPSGGTREGVPLVAGAQDGGAREVGAVEG